MSAAPERAVSPGFPRAPEQIVDGAGTPRFGLYEGHSGTTRWNGLGGAHARGALWRTMHRKRWHYVSVATEEVVAAFAIVDAGWAGSAFSYVFDRAARRLITDLSFLSTSGAADVSDRAGEGARSAFTGRGAKLALGCAGGTWRATAEIPGKKGIRFDATLDVAGAAPTACVIIPIEGGVANCTHKTVYLPATAGSVTAGARTWSLAGGTAAIDHTSGLLARDTAWRWATGRGIAAGAPVGFNAQSGFNGDTENVAWANGRLIDLGAVEFRFDKRSPATMPWHVRSARGDLDLEFTPEGARGENMNLFLAVSRYVQPVGTFRGTIGGVAVDRLFGMTEDHVARW